jgi:hypothetical protein
VAASFEIGCFHALTEFYEQQGFVIRATNLTPSGEYKYLTSPNGNPNNFSFIRLISRKGTFELRQQVRIRSHLDPDIAFTPDLVVLVKGAALGGEKDPDYASGKRSFFCVDARSVVAAHECKSMNPFPELLVSFLGLFVTAHAWHTGACRVARLAPNGMHLAPSLFVGGTARALHLRMIRALEACYPINIVVGLHVGNWSLLGGRPLNRLTARGRRKRKRRAAAAV